MCVFYSHTYQYTLLHPIQAVFAFLTASDVCRAACVSGKFHRVSESAEIWARLGVRRWEVALQNVLGLDHLGGGSLGGASSQFSRPPPKKKPVKRMTKG